MQVYVTCTREYHKEDTKKRGVWPPEKLKWQTGNQNDQVSMGEHAPALRAQRLIRWLQQGHGGSTIPTRSVTHQRRTTNKVDRLLFP